MRNSLFTKLICAFAALLVLLLVFLGVSQTEEKTVFQDLTVELGQMETVGIWGFLEDDSARSDVAFISDVTKIDLGAVGTTPITMRHGDELHTVYLTVQDTTAPEVQFLKECTLSPGQEVLPEHFVTSVSDASDVYVKFLLPPVESDTYTDQKVEIAVWDDYGNTTAGFAIIHYDWMRESIQLELGDTLTHGDVLIDPQKDAQLIPQEKLDEINAAGVGRYTIEAVSGESHRTCTVTVADTKPPVLELQPVTIYPYQTCSMEDFVVSRSDASGDVKLELLSKLPFGQEGDHSVQILATDKNGLQTTGQTQLRIHSDITPPWIYGLGDITLTMGDELPNLETGVRATDSTDGNVSVSYDASGVNLTSAGIYFVVYTASDHTGNVRTSNRRVRVLPNYADTAKLVEDIAKGLTKTDPESLRDFVRDNIAYVSASEWGGDDPVAYGFTKWRGNCKVHAMCLQALLEYFGYENEVINLLPQYNPHYWNLVKIDGVWYHIDSTPAVSHQRYSLMNNEQRLATLKGRRWDTSLWPMLNEEK